MLRIVIAIALISPSITLAETNAEHHQLTEQQISKRIGESLKKSYPPFEKMFPNYSADSGKPLTCEGRPAMLCNPDPSVHRH